MTYTSQELFDTVFNWMFIGWTVALFVHFIAFGLGYACRAVEAFLK